MLAESQQALQLALTAGAGDLTTAGLLLVRRRSATRSPSAPGAPAPTASAAVAALAALSWDTFGQLLVWAWERLGYDVEVTDATGAGVVDFILSDDGGYTYVQARGWQRKEVTARDIERLRNAMAAVGVERGIWMTCGAFSPGLRAGAERLGIRIIAAEELAIMVDRLRSGEVGRLTRAGSRALN